MEVRAAGDGRPPISETVGDHPTLRSSGEEPTYSWTEGMMVSERFRIVRCIGQGGMGMVYLVHDVSLDRPIALKRVPQEILFDGDARDDLRQEANRLLDLAHENIIRVHTYYDEPAWPFFAMEYLQGPTLKELLRTRKLEGAAFSFQEVLVVARQVERGLSYAHGKGVIHRDLKPGNLMFASVPARILTERDLIKITDFGISRVVADSTMRQTGKRSGTLPYMSPEQFRGEPASVQSDVYSLAATYYELLAGKPPFYTGDLSYQIVHVPPRPLQGVPRPLGEAILAGLAKNPRQRPASVTELTEAMEGRARRAIQVAMRRSRGVLKAAGLLAGALLAVLLVVFWVHALKGNGGAGGEGGLASISRSGGREAAKGVPPDPEPERLFSVGKEIQQQLYEAGIRSAINRTPFRFVLKKRGPLSTDLLKRIYFVLAGAEDPELTVKGQEPTKDDMPVPELFEFTLPELHEGDYVLHFRLAPYLKLPQNADRVSFRVDTTGPAVELRAVNQAELIEYRPGEFVTYNEETELRLSTPQKPGDIEEAYYQIYADSLERFGSEQYKIADPSRWRVTLVPTTQDRVNRFRVVAKDGLGNETARVLLVHRLPLEVVKFEIDRPAGGVQGNVAAVRGELRIDRVNLTSPAGEPRSTLRAPLLRYLVNEQLVEPEQRTDPTPETPVFSARLTLPLRQNTVELRYQWGDDRLRSFAVANTARLVQEVPAPRVELAPLPSQTNKTILEVSGRLSPYFDGLEAHLQHETVGSYKLPLRLERDGASFSMSLGLAENSVNRFSVSTAYRGQPLAPEGATSEVYCDLKLPRLLDPVEFRFQGEFLKVVVKPTEPLAQLSMQGPEGEWRPVPSRNDGRHIALAPLPSRKTEYLFRMVDLAGNENVVKQTCEAYDPQDLTAAPEEGTLRSGGSREGEAGLAPGAVGPIKKRSDFLRELGLDFQPYGNPRLGEEMGTTEVNQKAWNAFARVLLNSKDPEGDPREPMAIGEKFDVTLLKVFAAWLTEKSQDGYVYFIPSVSQWRSAFCGRQEPQEAVEAIKSWFRSRFRDPSHRYGNNKVQRIGERSENRTPTGLLDMESNLQEIVHDERLGYWYVIGGYEMLRKDELERHCLEQRLYSATLVETWAGKFTGFRVARKPARAE